MNILNVGTPIMSEGDYQVISTNLFSTYTLIDAEIIFWDVESSHNKFPGYPNSVNIDHNPKKIENQVTFLQRKKKEFDEFFKNGGALIITSPIFHRYEYPSMENDKKQYLDYADCLDIKKPQYEKLLGNNIEAIPEKFVKTFYNENANKFSYDLKIIKPNGRPLMYIKKTKHVVSEFYRINEGLIVILPRIQFKSGHTEDNIEFLNSIVHFIDELKEYSAPKSHFIPDWADSYSLKGEKEELNRLDDLTTELENIKKQIEEKELDLSKYKLLKALFCSDGDTLEKAVEIVLTEIGFDVKKLQPNRDDFVIKIKDLIGIVEIKGLTNSAAEKNAAQLQKWVSTYHADYDQNPKGILIVNTYKDQQIENRPRIDFPDQMMKYSTQMNHCLITGLQLLCIYLDFKNKKINGEKIITLLFDTVGVIEYCENPMSLITSK